MPVRVFYISRPAPAGRDPHADVWNRVGDRDGGPRPPGTRTAGGDPALDEGIIQRIALPRQVPRRAHRGPARTGIPGQTLKRLVKFLARVRACQYGHAYAPVRTPASTRPGVGASVRLHTRLRVPRTVSDRRLCAGQLLSFLLSLANPVCPYRAGHPGGGMYRESTANAQCSSRSK